jgi:hypothetical protein
MKQVARVLCIVVTALVVGVVGQSSGLMESLQAKVVDLYGVGSRVTIVSLPASVWGSLSGGVAMVASEAGGSGGRASTRGSVQTRTTHPGDSATGIVIKEEGDEIYIDGSPCDIKIIGFKKPFRKTPSAKITCNGKEQLTFKVVQEPLTPLRY